MLSRIHLHIMNLLQNAPQHACTQVASTSWGVCIQKFFFHPIPRETEASFPLCFHCILSLFSPWAITECRGCLIVASLCLLPSHEVPWRQRVCMFLVIPAPIDDDDDNDFPGMETMFYHLMNKCVHCLGHIGDFPPQCFLSNRERIRIRPQRPARSTLWPFIITRCFIFLR